MKFIKVTILACIGFLLSGCATQTFNIRERDLAYEKRMVKGAPKIIITDFDDLRKEKTLVGRVGLLYTKVSAPIISDITDAIALELYKEGFNLQKLKVHKSNQEEIVKTLENNQADFLLTGEVEYFYFWSLDALIKSAKGQVDFLAVVFNTNGAKIFSKKYSIRINKWIGFSPRDKYIELIEQMIDAVVAELFRDREFIRKLGPSDKNSNLITGMERLSRMHVTGTLSEGEFERAKSKLLE